MDLATTTASLKTANTSASALEKANGVLQAKEASYKEEHKKLKMALDLLVREQVTPLARRALMTVETPHGATIAVSVPSGQILSLGPGGGLRQTFLPLSLGGESVDYTVQMALERSGRKQIATQKVKFGPGQETSVRFAGPEGLETPPAHVNPLSERCLLIADVPVGMQLHIDDKTHPVRDAIRREFLTPRMAPDDVRSYKLRVQGMSPSGREIELSKRVIFQPGAVIYVSFME
jgi:hypothetical protein